MLASDVRKKLINGLLFQVGWLAAVVGGDVWAVGAVVIMLLLHARFWIVAPNEWWLILGVTVVGCSLDAFWVSQKILITSENSLWLGSIPLPVPIWLICLWIMFSMTLNHVFSWLHEKYFLAAVLGAVAGPLSYWSGAQLSDMTLGEPYGKSLVGIACGWGLLMPLFMKFTQRVG